MLWEHLNVLFLDDKGHESVGLTPLERKTDLNLSMPRTKLTQSWK